MLLLLRKLRPDPRFRSSTGWSPEFPYASERASLCLRSTPRGRSARQVKTQEDGSRDMKARIVPHGNRDDEKDDIRNNPSTEQLNIIRLLLSLVIFLGFRLATADIKGAYLQSGPIKRDIFVRPPREWRGPRMTLWKLLKLPYGIVEAGRQWQKTVEEWMLNDAELERIHGLSQLFTQRDSTGRIILLVAKVTDDFLVRGSVAAIDCFLSKLRKRFLVGKVVVDSQFYFNGCEIEQDTEGNIKMSMICYVERLKAIALSRIRRKNINERATASEIKQFRSMACTLLYLGSGVLPQASFATSTLQQMISQLSVDSLIKANAMVKELLALKPWVTFRRTKNIREVFVCTFTDASFNQNSAKDYGQSGVTTGLRIVTDQALDIVHAIDWTSHKQRRVSYSSYGAEILACADRDDRGFYIKTALNSMFAASNIGNELLVDSRCLYDTITTLHEGNDYRLRQTVQRIRNSFEASELNRMRWIADALTKRNPSTYALLNRTLTEGTLAVNVSSGYVLDSETWK